jgi:uncharacterized membrane protein YjfL (UPF0719 family)
MKAFKQIALGLLITVVAVVAGIFIYEKVKEHKIKKTMKDGDVNPANPNQKWSASTKAWVAV